MKKKILKTWMGVTSGTLGGLGDGYPERKTSLYNTLKEAVTGASTDEPGIEYFELVPISKILINRAKKASREKRRDEIVAGCDRQIAVLQNRKAVILKRATSKKKKTNRKK